MLITSAFAGALAAAVWYALRHRPRGKVEGKQERAKHADAHRMASWRFQGSGGHR